MNARPSRQPIAQPFRLAPLTARMACWGLLVLAVAAPLPGQDSPDETRTDQQAPTFYYLLSDQDLGIEYRANSNYWFRQTMPHVVLDGIEQVWICPSEEYGPRIGFDLAIRSSRPLDRIEGQVFFQTSSKPELTEHKVSLDLTSESSSQKFHAALARHYQFLTQGNYTGQVWFRHQLQRALEKAGEKELGLVRWNQRRGVPFEQTFDLFSGSQAIAENLQLDRELALQDGELTRIDVDSIEGITIGDVNWDELLGDKDPQLDELARWIPEDQHAIFLPSIASLGQALQELNSLVTPSLNVLAIDSNDRGVLESYLQQMRIDLREIGGQDFAKSIQAIAVTGSDPYSELGTDVGVLVQMRDAASASQFADYYLSKIESNEPLSGLEVSGGRQSADRRLSAYCFCLDKLVVIANSPFQIKAIRAVIEEEQPALADLKAYRFFRQRYTKTAGETAFVFMSDPAIRRWCGPRWRIGQSRRLLALAHLQRLQAEHLADCLSMKPGEQVDVRLEESEQELLGTVRRTSKGLYSDRFGSMHFMTPIAEQDIEQVTEVEKNGYEFWRDSYQRNWGNAFDPIGIQLNLTEDRLQFDLSVIPLILSSSYRWLTDGKPMDKWAGDLHPGTLLHLIAAPRVETWMSDYLQGLEFFELYADEDEQFWRDFTDEREAERYFRRNFQKLPVALAFHFDSPENLQQALDKNKDLIKANLDREVEHRYGGQVIRELVFEERIGVGQEESQLSLFVFKSGDHATFSLNRELIEKVVDRESNPPDKDSIRPWLGRNLAFQLDRRFFQALEAISLERYSRLVRDQSWSNLPLLNEWRREFPDQDPLEIQKRIWGEKLTCPGEGQYRWDEKTSAYISTAYGNPVQPRVPMGIPFPLRGIGRLEAGVSLDSGGIRAKVQLEKK